LLSLENRQNDRRLGAVAKVLHRAEVVADSGAGACTNASQANIIVGELREQNVTHDAIRTAQRGDDGERWIAEGTVSPSRLFLLVVLPSLLIASRYRTLHLLCFLSGDDGRWDDERPSAKNGMWSVRRFDDTWDGKTHRCFLPTLGSEKNNEVCKMASRAANSVVRRLAHRNIDWCVPLLAG